ncbi:MAG: putative rhizopine-binding transporter protein [Nocardioides sp.]|nr:putative rhizopine-binding transporter protein [Nocardioides sp.]
MIRVAAGGMSGRRRAGRSLIGAALVASLALTGCTTVDQPEESDGASGGGPGVSDPATDEAIRAIVDGRTIKVGFSPPILSEFYTQVEKAAFNKMKEYEDRYGVKWQWERQGALNDAHSGTETVGIVEGYISRAFDAVFVCSAAPAETMQQLYAKGSAEGVDFYQFNSTEELANPSQAEDPTGGLNTVSNIGYDDRWQSGYISGQYIAEKLEGEGEVLQIMGPSGSDWTKLRQQGFEKAISEYPGIEIVGQADGGYVRDKGFTAAQDLLTKFPDVDAIYGENEDMALGASQAIDAAGLKHWDGNEGIITIGADGLVSGMESIKAGKLTATVDVNSTAIGEQMIETLFAHEVLGMTVNQFVRVPTDVVDKENVDWHLASLKANLAGPGKY